jgi:hypothetical protein
METVLLPEAATAVVVGCTQAAQSHPAHQVLLVFTAHAPKNITIYIMYHKFRHSKLYKAILWIRTGFNAEPDPFISMRIRILVRL